MNYFHHFRDSIRPVCSSRFIRGYRYALECEETNLGKRFNHLGNCLFRIKTAESVPHIVLQLSSCGITSKIILVNILPPCHVNIFSVYITQRDHKTNFWTGNENLTDIWSSSVFAQKYIPSLVRYFVGGKTHAHLDTVFWILKQKKTCLISCVPIIWPVILCVYFYELMVLLWLLDHRTTLFHL
jgi:hypothetical protein